MIVMKFLRGHTCMDWRGYYHYIHCGIRISVKGNAWLIGAEYIRSNFIFFYPAMNSIHIWVFPAFVRLHVFDYKGCEKIRKLAEQTTFLSVYFKPWPLIFIHTVQLG